MRVNYFEKILTNSKFKYITGNVRKLDAREFGYWHYARPFSKNTYIKWSSLGPLHTMQFFE